jgi:hypothetical protein
MSDEEGGAPSVITALFADFFLFFVKDKENVRHPVWLYHQRITSTFAFPFACSVSICVPEIVDIVFSLQFPKAKYIARPQNLIRSQTPAN